MSGAYNLASVPWYSHTAVERKASGFIETVKRCSWSALDASDARDSLWLTSHGVSIYRGTFEWGASSARVKTQNSLSRLSVSGFDSISHRHNCEITEWSTLRWSSLSSRYSAEQWTDGGAGRAGETTKPYTDKRTSIRLFSFSDSSSFTCTYLFQYNYIFF